MLADLIGDRVMDWKLAMEEERAVLKRIVALLFALAVLSIAAVWACVPLYYLAIRLLLVRQDQVVDRQRADDVERQPPSM